MKSLLQTGFMIRLMNAHELEMKLAALTKNARRISREIVELIKLCLERKVWLERGHSRPVQWLMKDYSYSEDAAYRRLNAAQALMTSPELAPKIETGEVSLTALSIAQSAFRHEEKNGNALTHERKREVLNRIDGASIACAQRTIARELPNATPRKRESCVAAGADEWTLVVRLTQEQFEELQRAKDRHAHSCDGWAETLVKLAKADAKKNDPVERDRRRSTQGFRVARKLTLAKKDRAIAENGGQCAFVDAETGRRCDAKAFVQVDHIVPRANGGTHDQTNLICLCGPHNRLMAERKLGRKRANAWREKVER